jgi:hypothetical protein
VCRVNPRGFARRCNRPVLLAALRDDCVQRHLSLAHGSCDAVDPVFPNLRGGKPLRVKHWRTNRASVGSCDLLFDFACTREEDGPMKTTIRIMAGVLAVSLIWLVAPRITWAQDPVKVDPKHYKVEFENDQVRVLRVHFGPHEKSVMHDRAAGVAVLLTNAHNRFTSADGKTREVMGKAGETRWLDADKVLTENLGDRPSTVIVVQLKGKTSESK